MGLWQLVFLETENYPYSPYQYENILKAIILWIFMSL
jgi:hypothetical protein